MPLFRRQHNAQKVEDKYIKQLRTQTGDLGWAVKGLKEPRSKVPSLDPFWKLKTHLDVIGKVRRNISRMRPPAGLVDVHERWLMTTSTFAEAASITREGIDERDVSKMEAAGPILARADSQATEAASRLETFLATRQAEGSTGAAGTPSSRKVLAGPSILEGGLIARVVGDGTTASAEIWDGAGWTTSRAPTISEILNSGTPLSAEAIRSADLTD